MYKKYLLSPALPSPSPAFVHYHDDSQKISMLGFINIFYVIFSISFAVSLSYSLPFSPFPYVIHPSLLDIVIILLKVTCCQINAKKFSHPSADVNCLSPLSLNFLRSIPSDLFIRVTAILFISVTHVFFSFTKQFSSSLTSLSSSQFPTKSALFCH